MIECHNFKEWDRIATLMDRRETWDQLVHLGIVPKGFYEK